MMSAPVVLVECPLVCLSGLGVLGNLFLLFAFEALALSLSCVAACIARKQQQRVVVEKLLGRALCHLVGCWSRP